MIRTGVEYVGLQLFCGAAALWNAAPVLTGQTAAPAVSDLYMKVGTAAVLATLMLRSTVKAVNALRDMQEELRKNTEASEKLFKAQKSFEERLEAVEDALPDVD